LGTWSVDAETTFDQTSSQDFEICDVEVSQLVPGCCPGDDLYLLTTKAKRLRKKLLDRGIGAALHRARPNPDAQRGADQLDTLDPRVRVSLDGNAHISMLHVDEQRGVSHDAVATLDRPSVKRACGLSERAKVAMFDVSLK
jgi:hypothetical protein